MDLIRDLQLFLCSCYLLAVVTVRSVSAIVPISVRSVSAIVPISVRSVSAIVPISVRSVSATVPISVRSVSATVPISVRSFMLVVMMMGMRMMVAYVTGIAAIADDAIIAAITDEATKCKCLVYNKRT